MSEELDLTSLVSENQRRARRFGRGQLVLVLSADNCPGCEMLAEQLADPRVRATIAERGAYLMKVEAGDLYQSVPAKVRVGRWTLECKGFPTTWVFRLEEAGMAFHSMALGPLGGTARRTWQSLLEGSSQWVPDAGGMRVRVCSDAICVDLSAENDFSAGFVLDRGDAEETRS